MSFIDQIMEERQFKAEMQEYEAEFVQLEEQFEELREKAQRLIEGAVDFPDSMSVGEVFDEAQKRMKTARWAFGLVNKLKNPDDRKKHRKNIIIVMNQLRALINRLIKQLTVEEPAGGQRPQQNRPQQAPQSQNPRNPMGREGSMGQQRQQPSFNT